MLNSYLTASHWIVTRARDVSARAPGGSWDDSIAEAEGLVGGRTASAAVTGPEVRPVRCLWAQTLNLWASGNREATLHGSQKRVGTTKLQGRSGGGDRFLHTRGGLHPRDLVIGKQLKGRQPETLKMYSSSLLG